MNSKFFSEILMKLGPRGILALVGVPAVMVLIFDGALFPSLAGAVVSLFFINRLFELF